MTCLIVLILIVVLYFGIGSQLPVGSRSLLYGSHCWFIHPWFVARAWVILYGKPTHWAQWLSFVVHDWGYWNCRNMDGEEGEAHPNAGAMIVGYWCGPAWHDFCLLHSRYYAKRLNLPYSRLCVADKLAFAVTPAWVYIPCAWLSGEVWEYLPNALASDKPHFRSFHRLWKCYGAAIQAEGAPIRVVWIVLKDWHDCLSQYMRDWACQHRDGQEDTWTNSRHTA